MEGLSLNFSDLRYRQLSYAEVKDDLAKLWENRTLDPFYNELLVVVNQFIRNNNPENLDKTQVKTIKNAIDKLESGDICEDDIDEISDSFIESGMSFFPPIPGFSDLYED